VSLHRLLVFLAGLGVAVSAFSSIAWAHPGHEPTDGYGPVSQAHFQAAEPFDHRPVTSQALAHRGKPSSFALVIGALVMLASLPGRRRVIATTLALLLSACALEGVLHAALHLHHVSHGASLAIGAALVSAATAVGETDQDISPTLSPLGPTPERYETPASHVVFALDQGRAPPPSAL